MSWIARTQLQRSGVIAAVAATTVFAAPPHGHAAAAAGHNRAVAGESATIDSALAARLATLAPNATVAVFAQLRTRADLSEVRERDRRGRAKHVQSLLRGHAETQQRGARALLTQLGASGRATQVRTWWINDALSFTGTADAVRAMAARTDIASVRLDEADIEPSAVPTGAPALPAAANVAAIGAPTLWSRGITGAGVVVADLDTGVDGTQPDLAGSWRGGSGSWFDPYGQHATPTDLNGHGTWTTSVMVGRDGSGQSVGVAPDARWIAARVFDDAGRATLSGVHAALQWALNPSGNPAAPDPPQVLNASWSSATTACSTEFEPDLIALRAAGIVPVFAAGNSGPALNSGTSPATLPEALAVGSVNNSDAIDVSSSRGPSACGARNHFPDLVAPGIGIPVDDLYGGSWVASGTSLAAPHVAGALALLLSAHPGLTADQQQAAVTGSAVDLGAPGVDDVYGAGRLDVVTAEARLGSVAPPGPVTSAVHVTPNPVGATAVPQLTATLSPTQGGAAPVSASASVDGGVAVALTVTTTGGVTTAFGPLTGPLADGPHTVAVSATDGAGTRGAAAAAVFVVDRTPPTLARLAVTPSPTAGARTVTVTASANDSGTGIRRAEAWFDKDPGVGRATAMTVTPLAGSAQASLRVVLPVSALRAGNHTLSVRVMDAAANTSTARSVVRVTAATRAVFANGFESGGLRGWAVRGRGLSVRTPAALSGRYGLAVSATRTGGWVRASVPGATGPFNVRILFDPQAMPTGNAIVPILVENSARGVVCTIEYRRVRTGGQVRVSGRTASGAVKAGTWVALPSGASVLEVDGQPASGSLTLYLADVARTRLGGLARNRIPVSVDIGIIGPQPRSVAGTIRVDAIVANRAAHIGRATSGL